MSRWRTSLLLVPVVLAGCGDGSDSNSLPPLGRALTAPPPSLSAAPAPAGDPPEERNGTVPEGQGSAENRARPGSLAASPQAALVRYAVAYTNWRARSLVAHERELAALGVGQARRAAEQTAVSQSAAVALATNHVQNTGIVLAIALGQGPARGRWVVVTQERTAGTGPYAGMPPSTQVIVARTRHFGGGWAVSEWGPRT
jgi:hypothetical protein